MNRTETLKILAVLRGAYPAFYRDMGRQEADSVVALWEEMFADEPYSIVAAATKALIANDSKGFPPNIGAVKARIQQLTQPQEITDAEAWALVSRAVRKLDWLAPEKQFDKLPPDVRAAVGSPHTLVEWGKMDEATFGSVAASVFKRTYTARRAASRDFDALPADVKRLALQTAGQFALEGKT